MDETWLLLKDSDGTSGYTVLGAFKTEQRARGAATNWARGYPRLTCYVAKVVASVVTAEPPLEWTEA